MHFNALPLPDKEIEQIFNLQGTLSVQESLDIFQRIINKISSWLESVHLALFSLEQSLNQDMNDISFLEATVNQMAPTINSLSELNDIMLNNGVEERVTRMKVTKIQSEWSSLQHYMASVKQQILTNKEQNDLVYDIENLLIQMDDVSIMIFDFQEKKQHAAIMSPTSSLSERANNNDDLFSIGSNSDSSTLVNMTANNIGKENSTMSEIDRAFDTILHAIQTIYTRVSQVQPQNLTKKRFEKLKDKWEQLQMERGEFKYEYKEDRWSIVFKRVSDQVDVMIEGLDRSVIQCHSFIQHIKSWFQQQQQQQSSYKSILRSFQPKSNACPIDIEKFKSIEKSFEAKYKYYTPSIDRMLAILGNGILSRGSKETIIQQRHESMLQKWNHLKEVMNELRLKDLVEAERIISGNLQNKKQSSWKEIRYRTPEPTIENKPRSRMSPQHPPSPLRSSTSDSSTSSQPSKKTKTPRPFRNESAQSKREDFYDEDERYFGVDLMKPKTNGKRILSHMIERPSTTQDIRPRAKTPSKRNVNTPQQPKSSGFRSKSSLGDLRTDRIMSPSIRTRSITPSLIPRPKTPKEMSRTASPMIPQPRASIKTNHPPPVPTLPKYATNSTLRKKQSMPILRHKPSLMEISVNENGIYRADPKDPLDVEVAQIMNASPISIRCQRVEPGKYYFGNELSLSSMGGKKLYTCKLMTYTDRKGGKLKNNKVLIRVGGGWQDLEFFLLEHSSLMASDVVVRTYTGNSNHSASDSSSRNNPKGWKN
ncbi:hypothetical protein G6F61_011248 [Rhizopus arrhizus]|nr:hypothetical protein G6F61_011248 [Rhizopus arrhizus]